MTSVGSQTSSDISSTLDFKQARNRLARCARPLTCTELVSLVDCVGRVSVDPVIATMDLPAADNSAMDGYAFRHSDLKQGEALFVQECCFAGMMPRPLAPGHATRIFTGSLTPEGSDTVVMQEYALAVTDGVQIIHQPRKGQNVRRRGEDILSGQTIVSSGTHLQQAHVGILATQGIDQIEVFRRLRVGILTTGDELVSVGKTRRTEEIFDSNAPMLSALAKGMGAVVQCVLHARDDQFEIGNALSRLASSCDIVIIAGGVSVGEKDFVKSVVTSLGGQLALWKVRMKPGKPISVAHISGVPIVCLPGNPGAAFSVFMLLISPLIRHMQGRCELLPATPSIALRATRSGETFRDEFLRVVCSNTEGGDLELMPASKQGAGTLSSLAQTSGLARIEAGRRFVDGDRAEYYDFRYWLT